MVERSAVNRLVAGSNPARGVLNRVRFIIKLSKLGKQASKPIINGYFVLGFNILVLNILVLSILIFNKNLVSKLQIYIIYFLFNNLSFSNL